MQPTEPSSKSNETTEIGRSSEDLQAPGPPTAHAQHLRHLAARTNTKERAEQMQIGRILQAASIVGVGLFMMAASVSATTITFNTNGSGTGFSGTSLTLNDSSGAAATLTFIPDGDTSSGVPSNVNFGNFTLVCATCSTQAIGTGSVFGGFTFDLIIDDVTDGAT